MYTLWLDATLEDARKLLRSETFHNPVVVRVEIPK